MAVEWSTSAAPVLFTLDRDDVVPLGSQLERQLRDAIRSGRLAARERIPSTRALAAQLGVSRGLVQDCYSQLLAEGYLVAQTGSATRVADLPRTPRPAPAPAPTSLPPLIVGFPSGVPDLGMVPRQDWVWALREAARTMPDALFDYGDPAGDPELRTVLAAYLRRVRAVDAQADDIVICAGFAQGIALVLAALTAEGITVIVHEDPGSGATIRAAARAAGGEAVPVSVDEEGIDAEALARSGVRAAVLTPAHQWPTGVALSPERRHRLLDWAERVDGFLIEDEYDAEFRYDREPVGSMQGLAPDRVVSIGTVSKSLAPGLRLGWAVVPPRLRDAVIAAKNTMDRGNPAIDQRALALLMSSGRYDRHLRRMRSEYARRRDVLVSALRRHAPGVRVSGLAAGFHAVVHLPDDVDEQRFVDAARERGLGVGAMSHYSTTLTASRPRLILGFGDTPSEQIERGIGLLGALLREVPRS
jgi:GntR family transcriptional regulator/MocR family aminotransferase